MVVIELSKRMYEKEKQFWGVSLILRDNYGNRGYRYWCVRNSFGKVKGFMITQCDTIIAIEVKEKRKGYGTQLIRFCQQKFKTSLSVEFPTEESIPFYQKLGVKIDSNFI